MFETNMFKCIQKWILSIQMFFKNNYQWYILFNFEKEWYTFDFKKKNIWKKNYCFNCFEHAKELLKHHQFVRSFEQWNFISNRILKGIFFWNPMYYALLVIFQICKIIVLSSCFTPCASFSCVCTQVLLGHAPIDFQWSYWAFYT
jgi:hypothetical protein